MTNKDVLLVTGVQQSKSVISIQVYILIQIVFPLGLLQNIELSSLCYTLGPCWLPVLYMIMCNGVYFSLQSKESLSARGTDPGWGDVPGGRRPRRGGRCIAPSRRRFTFLQVQA